MSNNKYRILIVEDEENIRDFVETVLEMNGYQVMTAATCEQGMTMFASHNPDLVILDLGLPDRDGMDMIEEIRKSFITPVIVLSARLAESDKVKALDMGANDYIAKPFGTAELMARIRATLRNARYNAAARVSPEGVFKARDLSIDYARRQVKINDEKISLTQTEYNIVAFLSEHSGKVMTYSSIIHAIWGMEDSGSIKRLQVNMANIRKKFGSRPGKNRYILNELGVGYRMIDGE
ncbi:MAG: response regulator transcription factor [Anaerovoracaceae bacterium]